MVPKGWRECLLGELLDFKNGINADKDSYGKGTKFINISEILKYKCLTVSRIPGMVEVSDVKKSLYGVKRGDILFNRTSEVAEEIAMASVYLDDEQVVFGGFVIRGRPLTDLIDPEFSKYLFQGHKFRVQAIKKAQGAIRSNIGQGDLRKICIELPPRKEQEKIAKILNTWDEVINNIEKKTELMISLKKSLLKKTMTNLSHDKACPKYKLSSLCKRITSGGTPSTNQPNFWNGSIPWMSSGEVNQKYVKDVKGRITELGLKSSSTKIIPSQSVLVALAGQGKTRGTVAVNLIPLCVNQSLAALIPNEKINFLYLFYNLESRYQELRKLSTGDSGRGGLNLQILSNIEIPLPSLDIQLKISTLVEKIDSNIELQKLIRNRYALQRSGLMQQMLTGKVRVKV